MNRAPERCFLFHNVFLLTKKAATYVTAGPSLLHFAVKRVTTETWVVFAQLEALRVVTFVFLRDVRAIACFCAS